MFLSENTVAWHNNNPVSGFPVQSTLTRYRYNTGYKIKYHLSYSTNMVFLSENTVTWHNNNPMSGFPVQITLTRYRYSTGYKIKNIVYHTVVTWCFCYKTLLSDISELKWNTNLLQWLLFFKYDTFTILSVYYYATRKMLFVAVSVEFTIQSDFKWKHLVSTLPVKEWMIDNSLKHFSSKQL